MPCQPCLLVFCPGFCPPISRHPMPKKALFASLRRLAHTSLGQSPSPALSTSPSKRPFHLTACGRDGWARGLAQVPDPVCGSLPSVDATTHHCAVAAGTTVHHVDPSDSPLRRPQRAATLSLTTALHPQGLFSDTTAINELCPIAAHVMIRIPTTITI